MMLYGITRLQWVDRYSRIIGNCIQSATRRILYRAFKTFQICCKLTMVALLCSPTVYPKKYAHGFVVLCFVVVMQSFIMNSHEVFIHILQGCFADTGAIVRLPQCQWSKPDGYGKISQCITTTKHSKAKTVCIFLGIYCILLFAQSVGHLVCLDVSKIIWHYYSRVLL